MQSAKHVIVGTAGHIDHGKSALVEALTGANPDRLEEEKRRGITIDLGFAFLSLAEVRLGFVDVPGHERFVRNMLAGAGGVDVLLLAIAADESIKPQTREHFDICRLLVISRGLVAVTKSDLVDSGALAAVVSEIERFVRGSFLEGAPVIPVSARTGAGLDALKSALLEIARAVPAKDAARHARLPIDRSFAMKGFGTVVTGTLVSGALGVGDEIELYPARRRLRIRGLHSAGRPVERAAAGQRTAVNLAGIEHGEIQRGMVLGTPEILEPTERLDARVSLLVSARPLKNRARVHFHHGTAETVADVLLLDRPGELAPGETGFAQLRLGEKILALPGDRFILRQFSPVVTIGGGVVLDPLAPRHRRNDSSVAAFLETLERGNHEEILMALAEAAPRGLVLGDVLARTGWTEAEIEDAARKLAAQRRLRILCERPLVVAPAQAVADCGAAFAEVVDAFHRAHPLLPGIPMQDLRGRAGGPRPELFHAALGDQVQAGALTISGEIVGRTGRGVSLAPEEARAKDFIEQEFKSAGLAPPDIAAVLGKLSIEPERARQILQILLREKALVKVSGELLLHRTAVARLRELLADYRKQRGERLPVSAFKELAGVTRKHAIPLLEYLDREHATRREGNERVILG